MMRGVLLGGFLAVLCGCSTGYHSKSLSGGFSETRLDEHIFQVTFNGNAYTSKERVSDFVMLRSAELALNNNFTYFAIVDSDSFSRTGTYTTPTRSSTTASAYGAGNYAYGQATTTTTGGQTYLITKPGKTNTIVCFQERPNDVFVYNARFVADSVRQKHGIEKTD